MNKREMILKALVKFEGKWPHGYEALVVSNEENTNFGVGVYGSYSAGKDKFHVLMGGYGTWAWVCTHDEFEAVISELVKDAPEGATHHGGTEEYPHWYKKVDGAWLFHEKSGKSWFFAGSLNGGEQKESDLIPLPSKMDAALEQVVPEIDVLKEPAVKKSQGTIERPNIFLSGEYVPNRHPTDNVEFEHQMDFTKGGLMTSHYMSDDGYSLKVTKTKIEHDEWAPEIDIDGLHDMSVKGIDKAIDSGTVPGFLPPVGMVCEFNCTKRDKVKDWTPCQVKYVSEYSCVVSPLDQAGEFVAHPATLNFRPLKTEAEKERERLEEFAVVMDSISTWDVKGDSLEDSVDEAFGSLTWSEMCSLVRKGIEVEKAKLEMNYDKGQK